MPVWIAFVALTPDLCRHTAPLAEPPLRGRGWCAECQDVTVWVECRVRRGLSLVG
jgi:hypothetical protein